MSWQPLTLTAEREALNTPIINYVIHSVLGVLAKLQKATSCFILSVRVEQRGSHWMDVDEIWCLSIFLKCFEKIQLSLKSDTNNWYFTRRPISIFHRISLISS